MLFSPLDVGYHVFLYTTDAGFIEVLLYYTSTTEMCHLKTQVHLSVEL
jgi:hypothetical protein